MTTTQFSSRKITINEIITLPQCQSWEKTYHIFDDESALAIEMAVATGRPLLVRGEPGIGKSQLARAAAVELKRLFISEVVNIAIEGQDLLWRYDPVARLNDAQAYAIDPDKEKPEKDYLNPKHYISPGVLWWAFDCKSAIEQHKKCRHPFYQPRIYFSGSEDKKIGEDNNTSSCQCFDTCSQGALDDDVKNLEKHGIVLLIDEIDKADPSMPNSLLEVLGNGGFTVPMLNKSVGLRDDVPRPLVIITTNEERELPPAFIRRCLVLNLALDDEKRLFNWWKSRPETDFSEENDHFTPEKALVHWLSVRAEVHFPEEFQELVKEKVAELLIGDRNKAKRDGTVKPGQAEYLDLLRALKEMTDPSQNNEKRAKEQLLLLKKISPYALEKAPIE